MSSLQTTKSKNRFENHLHPRDARWFAVCTHYKHEKKVVQRLTRKGIHCYLPVQEITKHYTRKVKKVIQPLINCFVFVQITTNQYVEVLETESVVRFLKINRNLIAIPAAEIALLQRIVGEAKEVEVDASQWQEGDAVEVIGGQLTGLSGHLIEKKGAHKLVVALATLGIGLQLEVAAKYLRKVPSPGSGRM